MTVLSNGQEKTDDNSTKKNSSKNKKGPQGSGWLGLIVDDSIITGRLVIVKVSDLSPAMQAGIKAQDVLLAIDGEPVQTADQLAALLAAIPPDKQVRALIGRTEGVNEVTMTARTRPPVSRTPAQVPLSQLADSRGLSASKNEASRFTQSPTYTDGSGTPVPPPSVTVPPPSVTVLHHLSQSLHHLSQSLHQLPQHDLSNPRQANRLDFLLPTMHSQPRLRRQFVHKHRRLSNLQQLSHQDAQYLIITKAELH